MNLIEFSLDEKSYIGLLHHDEVSLILLDGQYENLYDVLSNAINNGVDYRMLLQRLVTDKFLLKNISGALSCSPPVRPKNIFLACISGIGYTHKKKLYETYLAENIPRQPEWFYKGNGFILNTTLTTLQLPKHALSCGEEAEMVLIYFIDNQSQPHYVGYTLGNDLSDPRMSKENKMFFGQSKLRPCSILPEVVFAPPADHLLGKSQITRDGDILWEGGFQTGMRHIHYSLAEIENLIFQHKQFTLPGMVHYVFMGADNFSFLDGISLKSQDVIEISAPEFNFTLSNEVNF